MHRTNTLLKILTRSIKESETTKTRLKNTTETEAVMMTIAKAKRTQLAHSKTKLTPLETTMMTREEE